MIPLRHPRRARAKVVIRTLHIRVDDDDDDALLLLLLGFYFRLTQRYVYFNAHTSNAHIQTKRSNNCENLSQPNAARVLCDNPIQSIPN